MSTSMSTASVSAQRFHCQTIPAARSVPDLEGDVTAGLLRRPRNLPPKYFYDARGSVLFDRICDTPEYYLTRAEDALLRQYAGKVIDLVRPRHILELGAGTARKTRHLFDACSSEACYAAYSPFDVCRDVLESSGRELVSEYEWLNVYALVGDYCAGLDNLPVSDGRRLWVFLGSTIGNFSHEEAVTFLRELRRHMMQGDRLLIGADRVKPPEVLHAAYNDAEGITAQFNLNLLDVLNRELDADFDASGFYHHACYVPRSRQIEMHLVARRDMEVRLQALDAELGIMEGETIRTEVSRKFTRRSLDALLDEAGFAPQVHLDEASGWFSLVLAAPRGDGWGSA